jgi:serine/threonine protein kinase
MSSTIQRQKLEEDIATFYIEKHELEFFETIGKGGFGVVFRGCYRGRKCAIKSIYIPKNTRLQGGYDDPWLDFLNEMNVQLKLEHQNILTVYGWSSDDTCVFVVMELMRKLC